nr:glycosyltransferase [uncultured Schaedlerella sp.]
MRIVLFYSETESLCYFTDRLAEEFQKRGHETFILDLPASSADTPHSFRHFTEFISKKIDAVICFDGIGTREDMFIDTWNRHQAVVVDILLDPPLRFHPTLEKHPQNYLLFCCDRDHVDYVKRYFNETVPFVEFMPHVGVMPQKDAPVIPYSQKQYDILFSGTYYRPEDMFAKVEGIFEKGTPIYTFYQYMFKLLVEDSNLTIEQAVLETIRQADFQPDQKELKTLLGFSEDVDWAIRMYYRGRVVEVLADAGFELHLLGRGWENHCTASYPNVHRIDDRIPYEKTLYYMADAKINLNVFPWFKSGTHDRIFNTLLQHSLPLTDPSKWVTEHFTDGKDIALYDLKHLDQLPEIAGSLLWDSTKAEAMIEKGYEKVIHDYTWYNCADWILSKISSVQA